MTMFRFNLQIMLAVKGVCSMQNQIYFDMNISVVGMSRILFDYRQII